MSFIDQSLTRLCTSNRHYCEPDEIKLPKVTEESKKEFYRIDMVEMFKRLLEKRRGGNMINITDKEIEDITEEYANTLPCREWGLKDKFSEGMKFMRDIINQGKIKSDSN